MISLKQAKSNSELKSEAVALLTQTVSLDQD